RILSQGRRTIRALLQLSGGYQGSANSSCGRLRRRRKDHSDHTKEPGLDVWRCGSRRAYHSLRIREAQSRKEEIGCVPDLPSIETLPFSCATSRTPACETFREPARAVGAVAPPWARARAQNPQYPRKCCVSSYPAPWFLRQIPSSPSLPR